MLDTNPDLQAPEADLDPPKWCRSDRIRIRIHFAVPDPYWKYRSGSRSMEINQKLQNKPGLLPSKRLLQIRIYVFWPGSGSAVKPMRIHNTVSYLSTTCLSLKNIKLKLPNLNVRGLAVSVSQVLSVNLSQSQLKPMARANIISSMLPELGYNIAGWSLLFLS
jgi:hypothetical protein